MAKHFNLDRGDTFIEPVPDALMEFLGGAVPALNISVLNSTTIQVLADATDEQQSVAIDGKWRYRQNNTSNTAAHPGGGAGTHDVYVTASDNAITPGNITSASVDTTVYSFGLEIRTSGTPATALYRKVAEVEWNGSAITALRHTSGTRRDNAPITPTSPLAAFTPLRVRAHASQSAAIATFENSSGTALASISATGAGSFLSATLTGTDGLVASGAGGKDTVLISNDAANTGITIGTTNPVTLYREAADVLATDDKLHVVGELQVDGALNHDGTTVGLYGKAPVTQKAALVNSSGLSAQRTLPANFTANDLAEWVIAQRDDTTALGIQA